MNFLCKLTVVVTALFSAADAFAQGYDPSIAPLSQFGAPNGSASNYGYSSYSSYPTESFYGYESQSAYQTSSRQNAARAVVSDIVGYQLNAPFAPRLSVDGIFGNRRGIDSNSTSVSAFLPWHINPGKNLIFGVVRGTSTDLGDFSGNFGIGHRYYFEELNRIFGVSGWYDIDDTHNQSYTRAGLQLESIGRYLEVRGGADIVLDTNRLTLNQGFTGDAPLFQGNNVAFNFLNTSELAYDTGYIEAGGPMPFLGRYGVNAYAGAYYLWHDDSEEALGWRLRTSAALTRDVQVGMNLTNDDVFGSNTSVNVSIAFPTGGVKQMFRSPRTIVRGQSPNSPETNQVLALRPGSVSSLMSSDVFRDHRTPVNIDTVITPVAAIDPVTGQAVCIVHVDPNQTEIGIGTFESPFRNLEGARSTNDGSCRIIRVVPRTDGTGTNLVLTQPFQLFPNQRLLSSSVSHQFATNRGTFELPGFTGGSLPLITNSQGAASSVVTMVDNTEVSGFTVDGTTRHIGINGNISGFSINRNTIQNATNGVQLANASGTGLIDQNTFLSNSVDGVNITVTGGDTLNLAVTGNSANLNEDDGIDITTTGSTLNATFSDNLIGGSMDNGIELTSRMNSTIVTTLVRNQLGTTTTGFLGNGNAGFNFNADSGTANIVIGGTDAADGNRITENTIDGIAFDLTGSAIALTNIQNNVIGAPVALTAPASLFDIVVNFTGGLTPSQEAIFTSAEQVWESIIIGDIPDVGLIDDVEIDAAGVAIDGVGGILGQAGPTGLRVGSFLPFSGIMQFDSADLGALEASGQLQDVILHEMAHVLGLGTIWNNLGLLTGAGGADPRFIGTQATAEYNARFPAGGGVGVPVANTGGGGTRDAHWRESVYNNELMTGFLNAGVNPISRTTVAQWADLGYVVDITQAQPFIQAAPGTPAAPLVGAPLVDGVIRIADIPLVEMAEVNVPNHPDDPGIRLTLTDTAVLQTSTILNNQINQIAGEGVLLESANGSSIDDLTMSNNTVTANVTGTLARATTGGTINLTVTDNVFNLNTAANTGFSAQANGAGSTVNINAFQNNTASNNASGNGVRFEALAGGTLNVANFTGNTMAGNGLNGAFLRADGTASVIAGGIGINGQTVNTFNSNTGFGIGFEASAGGSILGAGSAGNFTLLNNVFGNTGEGNGMGGVNAVADATSPTLSTLNLEFGGILMGDENTIVANTDVGIAYSLQNNSTGTLVLRSNTITNTVDNAATTTRLGQGVFVEVAGTSTLNNSVFDANTITNNVGSGVQGLVRQSGVVTDLVIGNTDGDDDDGNIITNNTGDGIAWLRRDTARVINLDIIDNTLMSNANGLNLTAQNAGLLDTYDVDDNIITMNTVNGVRLRVDADADLDIDMNNNLITNNTGDGINTSESVNTINDSRSISGTWTNNTITNNTGHGIQLTAATNNLIVGTAGNGNLISMNGLDGVEINSFGSATFTENTFTNNGTGGLDFNPTSTYLLTLNNNIFRSNTGTGVALDGGGLASVTVVMNSNIIDLNTGDGLEINGGTAGLSLTSDSNEYTRNLGRGIDILNQSSADSILSFNNDIIVANELEGLYVVNTASATQNQTDLATVALAADGAVTATPTLNLSVRNSMITGNGNSSAFASTGLILRVGTSDGGRGFTDPGGFASDGRGGVIATITNNMFNGNFGEDVFIEGFVSTVDPATTGGAWTDQNTAARDPANDLFTPSGYQSDPLARLDLIFTGNTGDSVDVSRSGASYNNAEAVFKSRTIGQDNGTDGGFFDDPGPFTSGTRARNAQRLAAREVNAFGNFTAPSLTIGASDSFLYPGVGLSTFRRTAASTTTGFTAADLFTDSVLLGIQFGELPFQWGTFVP
jgi:trimeric autotransporter adhesin